MSWGFFALLLGTKDSPLCIMALFYLNSLRICFDESSSCSLRLHD